MWDKKERDKKEANVISQKNFISILRHWGFLISMETRWNGFVSWFVSTSITCLLIAYSDFINDGLGLGSGLAYLNLNLSFIKYEYATINKL